MPEDEITEFEVTVTMTRTESFNIEFEDAEGAAEQAEFIVRNDFHEIYAHDFAYEVDVEETERGVN